MTEAINEYIDILEGLDPDELDEFDTVDAFDIQLIENRLMRDVTYEEIETMNKILNLL